MGGAGGPEMGPKPEVGPKPEMAPKPDAAARAPATQGPAGGSNEAARNSLAEGSSTVAPESGNQARAQSLSERPGAGDPSAGPGAGGPSVSPEGLTVGATPQLTPNALPLTAAPPAASQSPVPVGNSQASNATPIAPGQSAPRYAQPTPQNFSPRPTEQNFSPRPTEQNFSPRTAESESPATEAPATEAPQAGEPAAGQAPPEPGLAERAHDEGKQLKQVTGVVDGANRYNELTHGEVRSTQGPAQHVPPGRFTGGQIREPAGVATDRRTGGAFDGTPRNGVARATSGLGNLASVAQAPHQANTVMDPNKSATERVGAANSLVQTGTDVAGTVASRVGATGAQKAIARANPLTAGIQAGVDAAGTAQTLADPNATMTQKIMSSVRTAGSSLNAAAPAAAVTGPAAPLVGGAMKAVGTVVGTGADLLGSWMYGSGWK